jgi:galacturan 1,4-alpha-galacturonidase
MAMVYLLTSSLKENRLTEHADCVSFKPNSTNMLVQNLHCNGSHGISVGSLGQYKGEVDIVQNVLVYNVSMFNASVGILHAH